MDYSFIKGEYLEVEMMNEERILGYFLSQNTEKTRLSLFNVTHLPKGDLMDLQHFSVSEIKSVRRATDKSELEELSTQLNVTKLSHDISQLLNVTPNKVIFINHVDNRYHEAIHDLRKHNYISIGTDGAELGRQCKLSLLTISTPKLIYIFDVQAMQESAFTSGIQNLLESTDKTKIIHNSRKISDCLFHKHGVELKKVFDTQAADILVQKQKQGYYPSEVRTLKDCLKIYLSISDHPITEKVDIVEMAKRPVPSTIKEIVANNVFFMHQLHKAIYDKIMDPYIKGFEFYVKCQRQCSDSDAWYLCSQDKKLPKMYQEAVEDD